MPSRCLTLKGKVLSRLTCKSPLSRKAQVTSELGRSQARWWVSLLPTPMLRHHLTGSQEGVALPS